MKLLAQDEVQSIASSRVFRTEAGRCSCVESQPRRRALGIVRVSCPPAVLRLFQAWGRRTRHGGGIKAALLSDQRRSSICARSGELQRAPHRAAARAQADRGQAGWSPDASAVTRTRTEEAGRDRATESSRAGEQVDPGQV
ncbi:hypothetical protein AOLI_G00141220 [Acnodon oligacanthus]